MFLGNLTIEEINKPTKLKPDKDKNKAIKIKKEIKKLNSERLYPCEGLTKIPKKITNQMITSNTDNKERRIMLLRIEWHL